MNHKRKAVVAGSFYEANIASLTSQLENCFLHEIGPGKLPERGITKNKRSIRGVISPHAGFMFSGPIAAHHFLHLSQEENPETIIILGPNHRGIGGGDIAVMSSGYWETPLGSIEIEQQMTEKIISFDQNQKKLIKNDRQAHIFEHSIEVQLPFLQYIYPSNHFKIIPICISNQQLHTMKYLADILYQVFQEKSCLFIASSDFTHYEDQESAKRKDIEAIEKIISMDSELFYKTIRDNGASICGPGSIFAIIDICKKMGISQGHLLKYATSGDVSGMNDQVVGYASIIFQ